MNAVSNVLQLLSKSGKLSIDARNATSIQISIKLQLITPYNCIEQEKERKTDCKILDEILLLYMCLLLHSLLEINIKFHSSCFSFSLSLFFSHISSCHIALHSFSYSLIRNFQWQKWFCEQIQLIFSYTLALFQYRNR